MQTSLNICFLNMSLMGLIQVFSWDIIFMSKPCIISIFRAQILSWPWPLIKETWPWIKENCTWNPRPLLLRWVFQESTHTSHLLQGYIFMSVDIFSNIFCKMFTERIRNSTLPYFFAELLPTPSNLSGIQNFFMQLFQPMNMPKATSVKLML